MQGLDPDFTLQKFYDRLEQEINSRMPLSDRTMFLGTVLAQDDTAIYLADQLLKALHAIGALPDYAEAMASVLGDLEAIKRRSFYDAIMGQELLEGENDDE